MTALKSVAQPFVRRGVAAGVGETGRVLTVPEGFAAATCAREGDAGARWVLALPALVDRLLTRWELEVDGGVLHGYVALVVPVRRADGQAAMLKVSWVDEETRDEGRALARWGGDGAVILLQSAPEHGALLLERLDAHRSLQRVDEHNAVALAAAVLQLHVPPLVGLVSVTDVARRWQAALPREWEILGRPGAESWSSTRLPRAPSWLRRRVERVCFTGTTTTATCWPALRPT
jgi:streptomycin 6-kinase